jgi:hypothetical protein
MAKDSISNQSRGGSSIGLGHFKPVHIVSTKFFAFQADSSTRHFLLSTRGMVAFDLLGEVEQSIQMSVYATAIAPTVYFKALVQ